MIGRRRWRQEGERSSPAPLPCVTESSDLDALTSTSSASHQSQHGGSARWPLASSTDPGRPKSARCFAKPAKPSFAPPIGRLIISNVVLGRASHRSSASARSAPTNGRRGPAYRSRFHDGYRRGHHRPRKGGRAARGEDRRPALTARRGSRGSEGRLVEARLGRREGRQRQSGLMALHEQCVGIVLSPSFSCSRERND